MSILCHPLGSHFPVGRIEISNKFFKNGGTHFVFFSPHFRAFFPALVDLLALGCSLLLGSESLGLDHLFISSRWAGRHRFCLRGHLMGVVSRYNTGKKKPTFHWGQGGERGRKRVSERRKGGQHSCCLWRCQDAAPRHHIMAIISLATKASLAQLVTMLVTCLVISI